MLATLRKEPEFSELFVAYLLTRSNRIEEDLIDQLFNSSEKRLARLRLRREVARCRRLEWFEPISCISAVNVAPADSKKMVFRSVFLPFNARDGCLEDQAALR
ncbi:hypothetical protein [Bradyrhizobium sp. AUGA SZCCT0182]|uniref:hypothetical protein n=1 Tax=Bradyrhizobium sp. AUGA SZCCT0182 TaxID=2807667 RepID=UPI00390C6523